MNTNIPDYIKGLLDGATPANTQFPFAKLEHEDIKKLYEMRAEGMTNQDIANTLKVTPEYVGMIINGRRRIDDTIQIISQLRRNQ